MVKQKQIIKVIGVDIGGVIIPYLDDKIDNEISRALDLDRTTFDKLWHENVDGLVRGTDSEDDFWSKIQTITGKDISNAKKALIDHYISNITTNLELIKFLQSLSPRFEIVAMSNSIKPYSQFNHENKIYDEFHKLYLSNEIGYKKPDKEFFTHVIDSLGILPEQLLFIDDKTENIESAKKLGINTIEYKNSDLAISQISEFID